MGRLLTKAWVQAEEDGLRVLRALGGVGIITPTLPLGFVHPIVREAVDGELEWLLVGTRPQPLSDIRRRPRPGKAPLALASYRRTTTARCT